MRRASMTDSSSVAAVMTDSDHGDPEKAISADQKPSKGGWNAAIFIIFVEMAERFAFYGLAGNLITYLTTDLGEGVAEAAKNINTWIGLSALFPFFGGFLADSFLGRFKTILFSSFVYLTGMVILVLSVSTVGEQYRKAVFFTGLYILAVGEGGHKPCVQTFAADQFDETSPEEKNAKSSFFNWWYLGIVFGSSAAILVVIYVQDRVGWTAGFSVLAGAVGLALGLFLAGVRRYRKQIPVGSPVTKMAQVFVAAARKWRVTETRGICYQDEEDDDKGTTLAPTHQFRFLDKAAIIDNTDNSNKTRNRWRLCSMNQVEEVKLVIRLIPVWLCCLMFSATLVQLHTFFTKQGSTMVRSIGSHFTLPAASIQCLIGLTILVFVPIYDRIFIPVIRKITGHPSGLTILQRIGVGLFLSVLNMAVSGLVEAKRVNVARDHGLTDMPRAIVPVSVWWLLPQYVISGIADVFTVIGLQELFYDQMPTGMRSFGAAAYMGVIGVGSFLNSAIISVVQSVTSKHGDKWLVDNLNRAHLDYFYWVLAGLNALNLCVYIWISKGFVYKKVHWEDQTEDEELSSSNGSM